MQKLARPRALRLELIITHVLNNQALDYGPEKSKTQPVAADVTRHG